MLVVGTDAYLDIPKFDSIKATDFIIDSSLIVNEADLINGTSLMDSLFLYKGNKKDPNQSLEFPRIIDNQEVGLVGDIELISARITFYLLSSPEMFQKEVITSGQVKKEKMDVFETEYFENKGDSSIAFIEKLDIHTQKLLEKYIRPDSLASTGASIVKLVTR